MQQPGLLDGFVGSAPDEREELIRWLLDRGFGLDQIRNSLSPIMLAEAVAELRFELFDRVVIDHGLLGGRRHDFLGVGVVLRAHFLLGVEIFLSGRSRLRIAVQARGRTAQ